MRWKPKALLRTRGKLAKRDDQPHDILDENHNDHDNDDDQHDHHDETRMTFMIITGELQLQSFKYHDEHGSKHDDREHTNRQNYIILKETMRTRMSIITSPVMIFSLILYLVMMR